MKQTYQTHTPSKWAESISKFLKKFAASCRDLFDILWNASGSIARGVAYVMQKIFNIFGHFLNPVAVATSFMVVSAAVILWGLYSWIWIGVTLLGILGVPAPIAGFLGLVVGTLLNLVEIMPELGHLFQEYADVLGRAGWTKAADGVDRAAVTSSNFLDYSIYTLRAARNMGLISEGVLALLYQWMVGGFTKTTISKGIAVTTLKGFMPVVGAAVWVLALVKLPELTLKIACAAIHVAANLHPAAYNKD